MIEIQASFIKPVSIYLHTLHLKVLFSLYPTHHHLANQDKNFGQIRVYTRSIKIHNLWLPILQLIWQNKKYVDVLKIIKIDDIFL